MSSEIDTLKLEMRPFIKRSVTTGNGNVGGTTLVDATLVEAANFWLNCWVLLRTGAFAGQTSLRRVTASAPGTLTLDHTVGGQIVTGVQYVMMTAIPIIVAPGGGFKADLQQVLGQGADIAPGNELLTDPSDRAGRLLGIVYGNLGQVLQLTPADAAIPGDGLQTAAFPHVYDPVAGDWNRQREGAGIGQALVDVADRAARLVGVVYGNQAQLQQVPGTLELITQDTGLNTNPERWLHDNHWEADEVTIAVAGAPGQQNLGAVVGAGATRRIRVLSIRHAGTNPTVVTILIAGGATKLTIDVPAQTTRVWSSQDGIEFTAAQQPATQTSDVTGGSTYITPEGVEA